MPTADLYSVRESTAALVGRMARRRGIPRRICTARCPMPISGDPAQYSHLDTTEIGDTEICLGCWCRIRDGKPEEEPASYF